MSETEDSVNEERETIYGRVYQIRYGSKPAPWVVQVNSVDIAEYSSYKHALIALAAAMMRLSFGIPIKPIQRPHPRFEDGGSVQRWV